MGLILLSFSSEKYCFVYICNKSVVKIHMKLFFLNTNLHANAQISSLESSAIFDHNKKCHRKLI